MINSQQWEAISVDTFEEVALQHVASIYPNVNWSSTKRSPKTTQNSTAEQTRRRLDHLYWIEARHNPGTTSIVPSALDSHLVSIVSSGGIRRLHIVTSGRLSASFLLRAYAFALDHQFEFSYSDCETLTSWFLESPDRLGYFGGAAEAVAEATKTSKRDHFAPVVCSAFLLPEDDTSIHPTIATPNLVPGRKYLLVVAFSLAGPLKTQTAKVHIYWRPNPRSVYLLIPHLEKQGIEVNDITLTPIIRIPFRLLTFEGKALPAPKVRFSDGNTLSVKLRAPKVIPRLTTPFIGTRSLGLVIQYRDELANEIALGHAKLLAVRGRAGSGKSRFCDELRDEAQRLGYNVRMIRFERGATAQQETWRRLFRWIFGLEYNLFQLDERNLLKLSLFSLSDILRSSQLPEALAEFLIDSRFREDLFDRESAMGARLAQAVTARIRALSPILLHLDDAHHLSAREMAPLYFLRHIIESRGALPLCVLVAARNDETVFEVAIDHFINALMMTAASRSSVIEISDFSREDARVLISGTLRWPELLTKESEVAEQIIDRAGLNAFSLVQTMSHIAIDKQCVTFGHGNVDFLVDPARLKEALHSIPPGIQRILDERLTGLARLPNGSDLVDFLATVALLGRTANLSIVQNILNPGIRADQILYLLSAGYFTNATESQVEISHDLLTEALLKRSETQGVSAQIIEKIKSQLVNQSYIGDERLAYIYFYAGRRYSRESWQRVVNLIRSADETEDFRRILKMSELVEGLRVRAPGELQVPYDLSFMIAGAHQHCGNTKRALDEFTRLMAETRKRFSGDPEAVWHFSECATEAANQCYLRLELTQGQDYIGKSLQALKDSTACIPGSSRDSRLALAFNRLGAIFQVAGHREEARRSYESALDLARAAGDYYLVSHTLSDLGGLLRFLDSKRALELISESREVMQRHLAQKARRGGMLDYTEAYSECLANNTYINRGRLFSVASESAERGLTFQAVDALLCYAACAIERSEWKEGEDVLLKALDLTALVEDIKSRLFCYHYLSVCAAALGNYVGTLDYLWQAEQLSRDPLFAGAEMRQILAEARTILASRDLPALLPWRKYDLA